MIARGKRNGAAGLPPLLALAWLHGACNLAIGLEKKGLPEKEPETCENNADCDDELGCTEDRCEFPEKICTHYVTEEGEVCREKKEEDVCDTPEYCDGFSQECPEDSFEPATLQCRASAGQCDEPEYCTGSSPACPEDDFSPSGTECDDGDECTYDDICDGSGNCAGTNGLHDVKQISVGAWGLFTCVLLSTGEARCWGNNIYGQLGDGTEENRSVPVTVTGLPEGEKTAFIAAGGRHTCAILESGKIMSWGMGISGQLGDGNASPGHETWTPVELVARKDGWRLASGGTYHTCGIQEEDNRAYCWGSNEFGQLGYVTTEEDIAQPDAQVQDLGEVSSISTGCYHTCAIDFSGMLLCWGKNDAGQLGDPTAGELSYIPLEVQGIPSPVSKVVLGIFHTCALLDDGRVMCWGKNTDGQLGVGDEATGSNVPMEVSGLPSAAIDIASGFEHTCAVLEGGDVMCWGHNDEGQMGIEPGTEGEHERIYLPLKIEGLPLPAVSAATGEFHSCVLLENDTMRCWGHNLFGELGDGTLDSSLEPVEVRCR